VSRQPETAVLLAAGRGKRLRPYTDRVPKPLLPVENRPTLDYVLTAAAKAGIKNVCLVTHHLSEQIEAYIGDGSAWNLKAVACYQTEMAGTAHALQTAAAAYPYLFAKNCSFILTATDYLLPSGYLANLVAAHQFNDADITISLKRLQPQEILASSSVRFKENGYIGRIIEKPRAEEINSPFSASLTFILPGAILDYLAHMEPSPRGEYEIQGVINQLLQDGFSACGLDQETPAEWNVIDHAHYLNNPEDNH
jgi:mannose-1-phosphate guanylyltransferase